MKFKVGDVVWVGDVRHCFGIVKAVVTPHHLPVYEVNYLFPYHLADAEFFPERELVAAVVSFAGPVRVHER